jgi:uncharacterized membrane protein
MHEKTHHQKHCRQYAEIDNRHFVEHCPHRRRAYPLVPTSEVQFVPNVRFGPQAVIRRRNLGLDACHLIERGQTLGPSVYMVASVSLPLVPYSPHCGSIEQFPELAGGYGAMKNLLLSWVFWALLSAGFAALTAIFAKIGVENVNSDFATFIRTVVILLVAIVIVYASGAWQQPSSVSTKTWLFLILSGAATGASWICYFRMPANPKAGKAVGPQIEYERVTAVNLAVMQNQYAACINACSVGGQSGE